ncbi:acyl carrier protein [Nonomuraea purpurea]|uniref:Acyl carrier protein n=1 Tax=Nonomuraea purpurea TaxID=1849276 RepID=A0ABV8GRG7_9ACTN
MADRELLERVHALFAERRPIDLDVNFFEAGFSSLMLAQVLPGLRALGLAVSLTDLYRYPTVRLLAESGRSVVARLPWDRNA